MVVQKNISYVVSGSFQKAGIALRKREAGFDRTMIPIRMGTSMCPVAIPGYTMWSDKVLFYCSRDKFEDAHS